MYNTSGGTGLCYASVCRGAKVGITSLRGTGKAAPCRKAWVFDGVVFRTRSTAKRVLTEGKKMEKEIGNE